MVESRYGVHVSDGIRDFCAPELLRKGAWKNVPSGDSESGEGHSDILVEVPESRTGVVIELKYAENGRLDAACGEDLRQIEAKQNASKLENDGMQMIVKFGIACYKKRCRIVVG